jgi:hypothetical protein
MNWFTKLNRNKHFWYGMISGLLLTLIAPVSVALALECKDKQWGGKFDWIDVLFTILGGIIGQALQILLFLKIYN